MKKFYNKVNDLNIFIKLLIVLVLSFAIGFLVSNFNVMISRSNKTNYSLMDRIVEMDGFNLEDGKLLPTKELSYVKFRFGLNENYINRLYYKYEGNSELKTSYDVIVKQNFGQETTSGGTIENSPYINVNETYFNQNIKELKLYFSGKDYVITDLNVNNSIHINMYAIFITFIIITVIFILLFPGKQFKKIENKFLIIALLLGLTFIVCEPPIVGESWDEQVHYNNVVSLSFNGSRNLSKTEFMMMEPTSYNFYHYNSNVEKKEFIDYLNSDEMKSDSDLIYSKRISYNTICYLPMGVVYGVLHALNLPYNVLISITKFVNVIIYVVVIFFAIKFLPIGKRLMFAIGLFPTSLFLASHFSYDPTVTSFTFLGLSLFLKEYLSKDKINNKCVLASIIALIIGALPKMVYIPLVLLHLLYKKDKFQNSKQCLLFKAGILLLFFVTMLTFVMPTSVNSTDGDPRGGSTSVSAQMENIKTYPVSYVETFRDSAVYNSYTYIIGNGMIQDFAYIQTGVRFGFIGYLTIMLIVIALSDKFGDKKLDKKYRILYLLLYAMIYGLIFTALYLSFSPVGSLTINGVQPRYFIPVIFGLFMALRFDFLSIKLDEEKYDRYVLLIYMLLVMYPIYEIIYRSFCI